MILIFHVGTMAVTLQYRLLSGACPTDHDTCTLSQEDQQVVFTLVEADTGVTCWEYRDEIQRRIRTITKGKKNGHKSYRLRGEGTISSVSLSIGCGYIGTLED